MPSKSVQFLSVDEALAIQERLIDRFGGQHGVRDRGLLESALYRPQTGYYRGLQEMAAAMFHSLLLNHTFVDGNKRVAFFATDVFLRLNGWKIDVAPAEAESFIIGLLENGDCEVSEITGWIRDSIVAI
ncbi:MAG: type II toxin-antitoxin system death-on-curing family toxin [Gammaproteobacteria bacterium]|nr:type II toxin-antitoxin system death-on-curing family toxin [Gammaproteobacteria bacterium]MBT8111675.1 type II toxin-antitoxin system death-on-curing family toxin [Gammaproteobacteria bacterium]NNL46373.1 type II toxin-antitoxin system death-on-curing family toxin [Woeseiaceae bacterium]